MNDMANLFGESVKWLTFLILISSSSFSAGCCCLAVIKKKKVVGSFNYVEPHCLTLKKNM